VGAGYRRGTGAVVEGFAVAGGGAGVAGGAVTGGRGAVAGGATEVEGALVLISVEAGAGGVEGGAAVVVVVGMGGE
jgi:hypothetical protein